MSFLVIPCNSTPFDVYILSATGDAKLIPAGRNVGVPCETDATLYPEDWIKTGPGSSVTLVFGNNADDLVKIEENTMVVMKLDGFLKMHLLNGKMHSILANTSRTSPFRTLTPAVVTESEKSSTKIEANGIITTVSVVDGEIYLRGINEDGSLKDERLVVKQGYQNTTKRFESPRTLTQLPEDIFSAARGILNNIIGEKASKASSKNENLTGKVVSSKGRNVAIIDGEEVDILEYLRTCRP